jgi:hypothetical protein
MSVGSSLRLKMGHPCDLILKEVVQVSGGQYVQFNGRHYQLSLSQDNHELSRRIQQIFAERGSTRGLELIQLISRLAGLGYRLSDL